MSVLKVHLQGVGLLGPGIASWSAAQPLLRGAQAHVNSPTLLPPPARLPSAERRRAGAAIKLAMAVADEAVLQAAIDPQALATVFTSSSGEGVNCHLLCEALAGPDRLVSPTRFTNSVHNAVGGLLAHRSGEPRRIDEPRGVRRELRRGLARGGHPGAGNGRAGAARRQRHAVSAAAARMPPAARQLRRGAAARAGERVERAGVLRARAGRCGAGRPGQHLQRSVARGAARRRPGRSRVAAAAGARARRCEAARRARSDAGAEALRRGRCAWSAA